MAMHFVLPFFKELLESPRSLKRKVLWVADAGLGCVALWFAFVLKTGEFFPLLMQDAWPIFLFALSTLVPINQLSGVYRNIVRYMQGSGSWVLVKAASASVLVTYLLAKFIGHTPLPRSIFVNYWFSLIVLMLLSRLLVSWLYLKISGDREYEYRAIIYGAGAAGAELLLALRSTGSMKPVLFVDDAKELQRHRLNGLKIFSSDKLPDLITRRGITHVILAMPSVSLRLRREIIARLSELPVHVMMVPSLSDIASGRKRVEELTEVDIADLLGREAVPPMRPLLEACIRDKAVLVTGAGGSIGSELCRQILLLGPTRIVLYERSEYALYQIEQELLQQVIPIHAVLGCVQDERQFERILRKHKVETIFHAAAYKHVPLVEDNVVEGVRNNVLGTWVVAECAQRARVARCVLISTDKAVRPTNVMGASKRVAELILQAMAEEMALPKQTIYTMVRFGNVLDSSGSVVPLFRQQIKLGGPVTVTHPDVTRYFMTIPEAAQLVIQASSLAQGGEVYLLDMGESVKIADLAKQMIQLSGLKVKDVEHPEGDIEITYTGLRLGEKLYEELLIDETAELTQHPKILKADERGLSWDELMDILQELKEACQQNDDRRVRQILQQCVEGFAVCVPH